MKANLPSPASRVPAGEIRKSLRSRKDDLGERLKLVRLLRILRVLR